MIVKLLTEHNLEFLSLKGGCTGLYESTLVKMPHCWKSHAAAQLLSHFGLLVYKHQLTREHPDGNFYHERYINPRLLTYVTQDKLFHWQKLCGISLSHETFVVVCLNTIDRALKPQHCGQHLTYVLNYARRHYKTNVVVMNDSVL